MGRSNQPQNIRLFIAAFYLILFTVTVLYVIRSRKGIPMEDSEKNKTIIPFKEEKPEDNREYKWAKTVQIPTGGDCIRPEIFLKNNHASITLTASEYILAFYIINIHSDGLE
jgi:hypothetical protein